MSTATWLITAALAFGGVAVAMLLLSLGLFLRGRPLRGSCGGSGAGCACSGGGSACERSAERP